MMCFIFRAALRRCMYVLGLLLYGIFVFEGCCDLIFIYFRVAFIF